MTPAKALTKARKLWGKTAAVEMRKALKDSRAERELIATIYAGTKWPRSLYWATCKPFVVGCIEMGLFFSIKGEGETFEEAFAEAARRGV